MYKFLFILLLAFFFPLSSYSADKELYLYTWSTYISPELFQKFEKETGIKVIADTYDSNETLMAKLQSGGSGYDMIVPSCTHIKMLVDAGLADKVPIDKLKNFKKIKSEYLYKPEGYSDYYSIPFAIGTTGIAIDTSVYNPKSEEESWALLFNPPPALRDKVGMVDDITSVFSVVSTFIGAPLYSNKLADIKKIEEILLGQKPFVRTYSSTGYAERMAAGDVAIQLAWNGDIYKARQQRPSLKMIFPKEGVLFWVDSFALPKDSRNREATLKFIDFFLEPENAGKMSDAICCANAVRGSEKYMDPKLVSSPEFQFPKNAMMMKEFACPPETQRLYDKIWRKLMQ